MATTPNYQFNADGNSYTGTIPTQPGKINIGTSRVAGRVGANGSVTFVGAPAPGQFVSGQLEVASNLSLKNFAVIDLTDLRVGGTQSVLADNVNYLSISGAAADTVAVSASGTGSAYFSGLTGGIYAIASGTHAVEFDNVSKVYVHGVGAGSASDTATVTEDTQAKLTTVANLGTATLYLASQSVATPDLVDASGVGTLNVNGGSGVVKIVANHTGTVNVNGQRDVSFVEQTASTGLTLNVNNIESLAFAGGSFTLMGGNETVNVTQGLFTPAVAGQSAFLFDLRNSVATGPGDTITFHQNGIGAGAPGAHDATFLLGAGNAIITVAGTTETFQGLSRIAFIGGAGAATIHGGTGGSDVTFGLGTMDVTGGTDPNGLAHNNFTFGAYGAATTLDTIEDFKVGTDVLNLSASVEGRVTFTDTQNGTAIKFGFHTIDLVGVHGFGASNINWTH